MKFFAMVLTVALSQVAMADGFVCTTDEGDLNLKVYNHVDAAEGTRSASMMVLSDPSVSYGNKTIAKFSSVNRTLSSNTLTYVANVDLRFTDSRTKGENIAGTKLGELNQIFLTLDFSYSEPLAAGDQVDGEITFSKRNGEEWTTGVQCQRYLKN